MAVVVSAVSSVFVHRMGYRRPWLIGIWMMAMSMILMSLAVEPVAGLGPSAFLVMSIFTGVSGIAVGIAIPPSQAAYFDLRPDLMASAAGFRAMAGNSGGVFGTAIVTLALSQFGDKVLGVQVIFFALGIAVLVSQIWVFMVPVRGREVVVEREVVGV
jgi:MFS family permease